MGKTDLVNIPYVKKYNKEGQVMNPIHTGYIHDFPNRRERRRAFKKERFVGNGKNWPLTVVGSYKYERLIQHESDKDGNSKIIYHYIKK